MDHSKKENYFYSIDVIRVLAILGVILIHTTTKTLAGIDHNVSLSPFSLLLNQYARYAIPLFFLISGFVLEMNNTNLTYSLYFKKRASRVILPFISWTLVYFLIGNGFKIQNVFSEHFIKTLIAGNASYHLYFIPALVFLYLCFPFFHKSLHILKSKIFIVSLLVGQSFLLFSDYYIQTIKEDDFIRAIFLNTALFVLGIIASRYKDVIIAFCQKFGKQIVLLTLSILFFIFMQASIMTQNLHTTKYIYNSSSPFIYLYSLLFGLTIISIFESKKYFKNTVIFLSKQSFLIFFIHVLILQTTWDLFLKNILYSMNRNPVTLLFFELIFFTLVAGFSVGASYVIHKIPNSTKITG